MRRIDFAATVNRARTDALRRRPYCLSSEGVEREYKRTGLEEQGQNLHPRFFRTTHMGSDATERTVQTGSRCGSDRRRQSVT